ncbi:hypothetical protein [Yersinia aldovae]|uniref:hypothetical protein n=1 Tax=Yersinia aldovae TaxID=29483 RepID=UPI0011AA74EE|nr:hypothetical protein [Yersinia aldovae]
MGKISSLCKLGTDSAQIAQLNFNNLRDNTTSFYVSRSEFLFLFVRYLLALIIIIILLAVLLPDLFDELLLMFLQSFPAILSLVLLLPCSQRLAAQGLSPYLLICHLFPLINYLPANKLTLPLVGVFCLYLLFINIYSARPPEYQYQKQQKRELTGEYPFGLTLVCFCLLYISFFLLFELDDAIILLMALSWIFFLLAKWHWPVVALNTLGAVGVFLFFSSGLVELKHHENIIIEALIKISLLDNILFLIFSLSLFLNMLFWLEAWQRGRRPRRVTEG